MNIKKLKKLDQLTKLNAHENYLMYYESNTLASLKLKRKRVLAQLLKKILKFISHPKYDKDFIKLSIIIIQHFFETLDPNVEKVEFHLISLLNLLVDFIQDEEMKLNFMNMLND